MTHVVKGQLKGMMEETNKEKALKQVPKASSNEKILKLNVLERQVTVAERARETAKQKAEDL